MLSTRLAGFKSFLFFAGRLRHIKPFFAETGLVNIIMLAR
jgi:hypothetical protein